MALVKQYRIFVCMDYRFVIFVFDFAKDAGNR